MYLCTTKSNKKDMDNVFAVIKHDAELFEQDRLSVDLFHDEQSASKWLMQLVSEDVLHNGYDATIKSRYNSNGNIEMSAELVKGEQKVIIYTVQKTIYEQ